MPVADPRPFATPARLLLRSAGDIDRPVEVAKTLKRYGLSLRKAHEALGRIADLQPVAIEIEASDVGALTSDMAALGVKADVMRLPEVSPKELRERLGLSQADFAARFGLEMRTVQNWEQSRYRPDTATAVLLGVIDRHPEAVEDVLTRPRD